MKKKYIAVYYPQFHKIPENDRAWGEGFTDWTKVKDAKPLFEGHYQPRVPLNDNYYDLKESKVLKQQVQLAKKFGIHGFCFYHYWFDGKLMLEKPMENFLADKKLDIDFCISWANETWSKRWVGQPNYIIQHQTHKPDKSIWKKHFEYLLPCFKDKRYILIDNKPVFIIYQPNIINHLSEMIDYWNQLAIENGLSGIYFIATKRHKNSSTVVLNKFNAIMKYQPQEAFNSNETGGRSVFAKFISNLSFSFPERIRNYIAVIVDKRRKMTHPNSAKVWKSIINNAYKPIDGFNGKIIESAFVNWDNSPRYGNKANVFSFITPKEFGENISEISKKMKEADAEFLFINAWNEWAEGAYLEPDSKFEYEYLTELYKSIQDE